MNINHCDASICAWCGEVILKKLGTMKDGYITVPAGCGAIANFPVSMVEHAEWVHKKSGLIHCDREDEKKVAAYPT